MTEEMFILNLSSHKIPYCNSNGLLVTTVELKAKESFCMAAMLLCYILTKLPQRKLHIFENVINWR
jgi:hypothetical protein